MNVYRLGYAHCTSAGGTYLAILPRGGWLERVTISTKSSVAGTLTLYDNTAASGTVVAIIDLATPGTYQFGCNLGVGLTAVLTGTGADVTIISAPQ